MVMSNNYGSNIYFLSYFALALHFLLSYIELWDLFTRLKSLPRALIVLFQDLRKTYYSNQLGLFEIEKRRVTASTKFNARSFCFTYFFVRSLNETWYISKIIVNISSIYIYRTLSTLESFFRSVYIIFIHLSLNTCQTEYGVKACKISMRCHRKY